MASVEQNQKEKDRQFRRVLVKEVTKLRAKENPRPISAARRATLPTVKDDESSVGSGSPARLLTVRVPFLRKVTFATWYGREIRHRLLELTYVGDGDEKTPEALSSIPSGSMKDGIIRLGRPRGWGDVEDLPEEPETTT